MDDNTDNITTKKPETQSISDREGLPSIQLPSPIIHFCIAPVPQHIMPSNGTPIAHYPHPWPSHYQQQLTMAPISPEAPSTPPTTVSIKPSDGSDSSGSHKENLKRASHSEIEKRRRERINDKIETLKTLIPSCSAPFPTMVQQPIHKLSVLQAAIDYIEELHKRLESSLPKDNQVVKDILNMQSNIDKVK